MRRLHYNQFWISKNKKKGKYLLLCYTKDRKCSTYFVPYSSE